jgi:hypothetical protein
MIIWYEALHGIMSKAGRCSEASHSYWPVLDVKICVVSCHGMRALHGIMSKAGRCSEASHSYWPVLDVKICVVSCHGMRALHGIMSKAGQCSGASHSYWPVLHSGVSQNTMPIDKDKVISHYTWLRHKSIMLGLKLLFVLCLWVSVTHKNMLWKDTKSSL